MTKEELVIELLSNPISRSLIFAKEATASPESPVPAKDIAADIAQSALNNYPGETSCSDLINAGIKDLLAQLS